MKLFLFKDWQLCDIVRQSLFPEHVKSFFFKTMDAHMLTVSEYISSLFALGHLRLYEHIDPTTVPLYEYETVIRDFELINDHLKTTDVYKVYGIDPLDAIYMHSAHTPEQSVFTGCFHDDLYSLISDVDPDGCMEYFNDMLEVVCYILSNIERYYLYEAADNTASLYMHVSSSKDSLSVIVR